MLLRPARGSVSALGFHATANSRSVKADLPRSSLAGLPLLRLLSLTIAGEAVPHRELGALHRLEELHVYLAPSTPARFDFQPGKMLAQGPWPPGLPAVLRLHAFSPRRSSALPARPARMYLPPPSVLRPAGSLAALRRLRCVLLIATSSLCEALTVGPGLAGLPSLQELQVGGVQRAALP